MLPARQWGALGFLCSPSSSGSSYRRIQPGPCFVLLPWLGRWFRYLCGNSANAGLVLPVVDELATMPLDLLGARARILETANQPKSALSRR